MTTLRGITFPAPDTAESADAERPTTPTVRGIVTDAVRGSDAALAARVEGAKNWREAYLAAVRDLTMTTASTPQAAVDIARAGLDSAYRRMRVVGDDGHETPLAEWAFDDAVEAAHGTYENRTIDGRKPRVEALAVPYKGRDLTGHDLERQLDTWVAKGVIEASCAEAVKRVINHPEWLSLPGHVLASVGAGAEMGPTDMLSRWGARILAVDIPRVSERLAKFAEAGAGSITLPVRDGEAGADIVADPAGVAAWFADNAGDDTIVFGMHAYADSGMHIRLTLAADAIGQYLQRMRPTTVLATSPLRQTPSSCRRRSSTPRGDAGSVTAVAASRRKGYDWPRGASCSASRTPSTRTWPTASSRSRARTTPSRSDCSAGVLWRRRPTASACRSTSPRPRSRDR